MLVLALGCVFLILIIPLAAWALAAKTRLTGPALAAGLLACGAGWLWLMAGWVVPDQVANTVLALAVLTPALIMAGRLASPVDAVLRAPAARGPAALGQVITGPLLAAVCVCLLAGAGPVPGQRRYEGWLLGREEVCIDVQSSQNTVQVLLQSGPE